MVNLKNEISNLETWTNNFDQTFNREVNKLSSDDIDKFNFVPSMLEHIALTLQSMNTKV